MSQAQQAELFVLPTPALVLPAAEPHEWKAIRQINGASGRYRKAEGDLIVADFGQGDEIQARWQPSQGGRWRGVFKGRVIWCRGGKGEIRGWLSSAAVVVQLVRQAREMEAMAKAQAEMASRHRASLEQFQASDIPTESTACRAVRSAKLCKVPVKVTWKQRRYVPAQERDYFAKVPKALIPHCPKFAAGEWRVLLAILNLATDTGLIWGRAEIARRASVHEKDVKQFRDSLVKRAFLRKTGNHKAVGAHGEGIADEYELLWHPWFGETCRKFHREEKTQVGGGKKDGGGGKTDAPIKKTSTSSDESKEDESPDRTSQPVHQSTFQKGKTRALSRGEDSPEEEALGRLSVVVGPTDAVKNRGLWITYFREDPVAFREALGDCENKKREGFKPKTNWGGVITEAFKRIRDERKGGSK